MLLDQLILSNRFAGPLLNFRRKFERLVKEGVAEKVRFRKKDFYRDIEENYNLLCSDFERVAASLANSPQPSGSEHAENEHDEVNAEPVESTI